MNAAEDRLSEMMDAATRALAPPIELILAEGERLGRRRRRRRRAAVAISTVAVVLIGGVGAAAGLRLSHMNHEDDVAAAPVAHRSSHTPISSAPASPSPSSIAESPPPSPTATAPGTSLAPITSQAAAQILKRYQPDWIYGSYDPVNNARTSLLDTDVNDGKGLARVFVGIGTAKASGMDPADCSLQKPLLEGGGTRPAGAPPSSCDVKQFPNGDQVMQEVLKADTYGEYQYRIIAYRADGIAVEITASNGDWISPATEVTRAVPPLSVAEWTAIALDRAWKLEVPRYLTVITPTP